MRIHLISAAAGVAALLLNAAGPARAERDVMENLPGVFNGALQAEKAKKDPVLAEMTRQFDALAAEKEKKGRKYKLDEKYLPQIVPFKGYKAGTIVIDTQNKFLYLVERWGKARR